MSPCQYTSLLLDVYKQEDSWLVQLCSKIEPMTYLHVKIPAYYWILVDKDTCDWFILSLANYGFGLENRVSHKNNIGKYALAMLSSCITTNKNIFIKSQTTQGLSNLYLYLYFWFNNIETLFFSSVATLLILMSVCLSICPSVLGENMIFSAPN